MTERATDESFDFLVLGGGSGGLASARRAAQYGARVALIEAEDLGGTCVNRGCVPKKMLWNAAQVADAQRDAHGYGFEAVQPTFEWGRFKDGRDKAIQRLRDIYARNLDKDGVNLVRGYGRLVGPRQVEVDGRVISGQKLLVATGGAPLRPALPGAELGLTSDEFFEMTQLPRSVLVVGGGYIAVETAGVLQGLGSRVALALRGSLPLKRFDALLRTRLDAELRASGIDVITDFSVAALTRVPEGLAATGTDGRVLTGFDAVIWAVGRSPHSRGFGLEEQGVTLDEGGFVQVDEWQATSAEGVFAIGDVTGRLDLTPVAIAAGRRLADRLFGGQTEAKLDYTDVPTVVFSHPPIGTVGLTEDQASARFGSANLKIYQTEFGDSYMTFAHRRVTTSMKLVCEGSAERVVGIHCIGRSSDELIQGFAVALRMGATKADLDRTVAIHPTAAEELVTMR